MATASTKKFFKNVSGVTTEEAALLTSDGAASANRIPALNASGVLDPTIVNSAQATTGVPDAGKVAALGADGLLSLSMMPVGVGTDVKVITTSEALAAGDYVNIWDNAGFKVRKADATVAGKEANGYVLASFGSGAQATVYMEGTNTSVTGMVAGTVFLSTTAGAGTATAPSGSGNVIQCLGISVSATAVNFSAGAPIVLA